MSHDKNLKSEKGMEMLKEVRQICGEFPEVEEIIDGFGHTTFKVRQKSFVMMGENEEGVVGLSFKSDRETQELLLQQARYVKTPYIGHHGWVSIKSEEPIDWDELTGLIKEAYLKAAPKRLAKELLKQGS
ncbi:MmcQ/YjbR family DNA-binding protein [Ammoniphilus sp. CFH 90114]|uniref:MmcQ/YjbR family DNA-binding protein n=1 Tax=Ammoniphilus sp. CFH 90114 TaxID=2493665 RepID=UPI00100EB3B4|nr:MmcQ/YjbR family DNA-binding protein [Ammoniphilus sp. CFH 90114]RXT01913.1 MmcQ/YjbR family DNA-binding protein [Ammoniphilus sp. CFH 90114]